MGIDRPPPCMGNSAGDSCSCSCLYFSISWHAHVLQGGCLLACEGLAGAQGCARSGAQGQRPTPCPGPQWTAGNGGQGAGGEGRGRAQKMQGPMPGRERHTTRVSLWQPAGPAIVFITHAGIWTQCSHGMADRQRGIPARLGPTTSHPILAPIDHHLILPHGGRVVAQLWRGSAAAVQALPGERLGLQPGGRGGQGQGAQEWAGARSSPC